jgi:hypothetical protein
MENKRGLFAARTLCVSIAQPPEVVAKFVWDAANLPRWAKAFCQSIERTEHGWLATTPAGEVQIEFAAPNDFGVLDHTVYLSQDVEIHVPMRVVRNGAGSEVMFTLLKQPSATDAEFERDVQWVSRDLHTLRDVLERR